MSTPTFQVWEEYGEEGRQVFYINRIAVGECDHDSHGWDGMEAVRRMFVATAAVFGVAEEDIEELEEEL